MNYTIVDKNNKYLTRRGIESEVVFTDNKNFAYSFNVIEEAEKMKNFAEEYFNQKLKILEI